MKKITILLLGLITLPVFGQLKADVGDLPSKENKVTAAQAVSYIANNEQSTIETVDIKKFKVSKEDQDAFDLLMSSNNNENSKKPITTEVLNEMLKSDENDQLSLLLVKNNSHCNMVLKIEGKTVYNIPVPAKGQNAIMVEKGIYTLKGNLCELKYEAQKDLNKNILVALTRKNDN
ncbi:hypothetical protein GCM10010992_23060 [Cloacibacterium rupense]|uniref:DUF6759 domain-containing protein n=1 Tax=Cloacibacterium rupense TaxID=517423 RepID=A0ABQ2NME2_9FLAO|nr:DUF6759 domain-containing protein [Cloacibacterium rupense]GGP05748.1 hypothetical protein GCM10010992_23060 [Cloacibacterium rupense]